MVYLFKTWGRFLTHFSMIFYREKESKKSEKHRYQDRYQWKYNIYRRSDKRKIGKETAKNLKSSIWKHGL